MSKKNLKIEGIDWVVDKKLARASAPPLTVRENVQKDVDAWIQKTRQEGVKSIICLLGEEELLMFYGALPGGLLGYYESHGLSVQNIPADDYQSPPLEDEHLHRIWDAFQSLPKPVLVHCRHGVSRTGHALDYIESKLNQKQAPHASPLLAVLPFLSSLLS